MNALNSKLERKKDHRTILSDALKQQYDDTLFLNTDLSVVNTNVSKLLDADPSLQVVIRGDGKVEYEKGMVIMAQLQSMGAKDIGLITKEPLQ